MLGGTSLNLAVVDDVLADRVRMTDYIRKYSEENAVAISLSSYEDGEDFLVNAQHQGLDAVFLDIYMGEVNGFSVAQKLRKIAPRCAIVFVTTSADFAVKSYEVRAFYYMLKPYTYEDISKVVDLLDKSMKKSSRYIKVKESREWRKIFLEEIYYADYNNHYVQIHTENAIISTYMKFSEFEEILSGYKEFITCYRCVLVNMNKIKKIEGLFFLINNGEYIPINRKRGKEIKEKYVNYIFGDIEED